jgi:hypothetical protein
MIFDKGYTVKPRIEAGSRVKAGGPKYRPGVKVNCTDRSRVSGISRVSNTRRSRIQAGVMQLSLLLYLPHPSADPGISGGGMTYGRGKIGRGLVAAVGPQRGPGAEPLGGGVKGAKPPMKVTPFSRIIQ